MWMTRKFMITTTRMRNPLMGRVPIDRNQGLLSTTRRMAMVIKISNSMDAMGMNTTLTATLKLTTKPLKTTTMICGNCNVDDVIAGFSCSNAYTMEYSALFILGTEGRVGLNLFQEGNRWKHSVWLSRTFHTKPGNRVVFLSSAITRGNAHVYMYQYLRIWLLLWGTLE